MQKDWIYIIVGGLLEIFWALTMKLSVGFTQPFWSIITIILLLISFYIFAKGMEKFTSRNCLYNVYRNWCHQYTILWYSFSKMEFKGGIGCTYYY